MRKSLFIVIYLLLFVSSYAQQYIVNFDVENKEEAYQLPDFVGVEGYDSGNVTAYLYGESFKEFQKLGYDYVLLDHPSKGKSLTMATTVAQMANWDRYPTHSVYLELMQDFADDYPDICRIETIGNSEDGRPVRVLKISDNPDVDENEPEFFYTGQMHGDEIVAYIMFLRLADYLLANYNSEQRVTDLINNVEIWINPLSNPDGTYAGGNDDVSGATRSNSNWVDLNRSFPSPNLTNPSGQNEAEVQMMIAFAESHNFVLSANSHSGIELVNFPWDSWVSSTNMHADHNWWNQVSWNYANTVHANSPSGYFQGQGGGVTHGGDWYVVDGSRQDNMGYYHNCREVTLELSDSKMLDCNLLPAHFTYNCEAMIGYIEECTYGIRGIVTDEDENPLDAIISISGHDKDNSEVLTDQITGTYHRMIDNGTYNLTFTVAGYTPITVNNISVTDEEITIVDVMFDGSPSTTTLSGTITNNETNAPIENAELIVTGQDDVYTVYTDSDGEYSIADVTVGTYRFEMSAYAFISAVHVETVSSTDSEVNKSLVPQLALSGTVIDASAGLPIENAEISFPNTSIVPIYTNAQGEYIVTLAEGEYDIKANKSGYAPQIVTQTISEGNSNVVDFALLETEAITFESDIPNDFTLSGNADWFRTDDEAYEGDYSVKSGSISDNQSTTITLSVTTEAGEISFYKKVSSEAGYDKLVFSIDGTDEGEWSGDVDWTQSSYDITEDSHTFVWTYSKDDSADDGSDCAWIDFIELPVVAPATYNVTFTVLATSSPVEDANVNLVGYGGKLTNSSGQCVFNSVYESSSLSYNVSADGYELATGSITVDGNETEIVNLTVDIDEFDSQINIYPNPTEGVLFVKTYTNKGQIVIYSLNGVEILNEKISSNKTSIDLSNQESGIYLMKFYTNEGIYFRKIILK